jgi:hypothetical protein
MEMRYLPDNYNDPKANDKENNQLTTTGSRFSNFCQQTSLHGWQYLDSESKRWRKIIWAIFILASILASVNFLHKAFEEYVNATTVTSIDSTTASLNDIIFPSVIICNVNQVKSSFLSQVTEDDKDARLLFKHFLTGSKVRVIIVGKKSKQDSIILKTICRKK